MIQFSFLIRFSFPNLIQLSEFSLRLEEGHWRLQFWLLFFIFACDMIWKVNANFLLFSEIYKLISVMFPLVLNINGFKDFRVCFRERRIILFYISITCHIELTFRCLIGRQLFKAYVIGICSIFAPKWTALFLPWITLPKWTAFSWIPSSL